MRRNVDTNEKSIVCPFFKWTDNNHIACEGVCLANTVSLNFGNPNDETAYKNRFCRSIDGYKECRICEMLMVKYEDDGK